MNSILDNVNARRESGERNLTSILHYYNSLLAGLTAHDFTCLRWVLLTSRNCSATNMLRELHCRHVRNEKLCIILTKESACRQISVHVLCVHLISIEHLITSILKKKVMSLDLLFTEI